MTYGLAVAAFVHANLARTDPIEKRIWKLLAFLARYGHQPVSMCLRLPVTQLKRLADGVAEILEEEKGAPSFED